ncbi:transposase [Glaciimonas sp. CA11.2]|uniref:transposase n=1 Tax=unclassified Glaciimonas TaxID=2644401 RepID=UPI002AB476B5|nr:MULTISPECIES: transposase [unclassified Glaciimonas]MDY7546570.1 transposase [Glaciimonas sp. CA11.2]MEB0011696.1 transposase [Glaciimonas sp. Cout2]MEB0080748.1 transposase [Glaciimonas sp. Gout2]MEB0161795.1 transposase [Glaciimonas sp. CA11.2]
MARLARLVAPHQPHYLIQRGIDQQTIFRDNQDYLAFYNWLKTAARQFKVGIHAYLLMGNQIQLLATPSDAEGLARMMQWVGRYYVPYFNQRYARVGTLWQGRYKAAVIDPEQYLMKCSLAIDCYPAHDGLEVVLGQFAWSSYLHHVGVKSDPLISDHPLYWALGNTPFDREATYKELAEQVLTLPWDDGLIKAVGKGWVLGSEAFKFRLEQQYNQRVRPARRGRPFKIVATTAAD